MSKREAYKIKNNFSTVIVVEKRDNLYTDKPIYVLSDGTEIYETLFLKLYNKVDGTKIGDSSFLVVE